MVEWKKLGEVCTFNRGRTITAKDAVDGGIPVIAGGQAPSYYHNESNREGESITVAGSGAYAGFISYWNQPIFVSDAFTVDPKELLKHKYLFHWLKHNQSNVFATQKGAGVPHVHGKDIANFLIPIPSLEEQTRIVGILDTFTSSIDNLKEQIAQRRKQYEYYRDQLINKSFSLFSSIFLKDVAIIKNGKDYKELGIGDIPVYGSGGIMTYVDTYASDSPSVLLPRKGSVENIFYVEKPFWTVDTIYWTDIDCTRIIPKYLFYALSIYNLKDYAYGGARPSLSQPILYKLRIPLPPLSEQQRIVSILDTFEASIQNLEAQLKEREKQYEYYRNKLLTFE